MSESPRRPWPDAHMHLWRAPAGLAAARDGGWRRLYSAAKDTESPHQEAAAAALPLPLFDAAADE